ncbi:MAG TPA: response regulator transcription factor [Mycobacteriales bacterium]|nr:response regulator transcription factor [Mycobacteriales bacterium]
MTDTTAAPIPTLIVDDQDDIRLLLRMVIDRANHGLHVIGEAASASEALAAIDSLDPMVVIMDEMMPGMTGLDAMAELRGRRPQQIVIICSAYLDDDVIARAREGGANGWLPKDQMRVLPELIQNVVTARRPDVPDDVN